MDMPIGTLSEGDAGHSRLLQQVAELLPAMAARAAGHDQAGTVPRDDIAALWGMGGLSAVLPVRAGGLGLGTEPYGAGTLSRLLRLLGRGNLAVGRLFEAHVNAIRLIAQHGTPRQLGTAAVQVQSGALFGLWVTDPAEHPLCAGWDGALRGGKAFCSGAGFVERAVVTLRDPGGDIRLANVPTAGSLATPLPMQMQGMRGAKTGRVSFEGMRIDAQDWIGQPGDYMAEPDFSGGAWRTSAVTCGGLEELVTLAMRHLRDRGRASEPHQQARMGRAWIAKETALLWLDRAAATAEQDQDGVSTDDIVNEVGLARIAIEAACVEAMHLVERSLGLAAFMQPSPIERIGRDLATYLRQPAADEVLAQAAAHVMQTRIG